MTRLFEYIAHRALTECGARVAAIYGQVTEVGATVLYAWKRAGDADETRLRGAFGASQILGSPDAVLLIPDVRGNDLVDGNYAEEEGIKSAALFKLEMKDQLIVVAFGFSTVRELSACSLSLYSLAIRLALLASSIDWPVESLTVLAEVVEDMSHALENTSTLGAVLESIGGILQRGLDHWNLQAYSSFWRLTYESWTTDGQVLPILRWEKGYGREPRNPLLKAVAIGEGVVGWVAKHLCPVNVLPRQAGETLPSLELVNKYYKPFERESETQAELAVPMVYQNHLVGVLNIESPIGRRFFPEHVLLASVVAAHAAQVIHQQRLELFYNQLLGFDDLTTLAEAIVHDVGQFIEAPLSSIFLWDLQEQGLILEAASTDIITSEGRKVEPGEVCYVHPGVGFVRWAFENKMWLLINDVEAFTNPEHPNHAAQSEDVLNQVWRQCSSAMGGRQEREVSQPDDERRYWSIPLTQQEDPEPKVRSVPEPIWSEEYSYRGGHSRVQITIPILDSMPERPALGVMRFSRRDQDRPFTEHDVDLLQWVARQVTHTITRARQQQSRELEKSLISEVVTMEPGRWDSAFQHRLERQLEGVRRVTGADIVLVRARHGDRELSLVAAQPTEAELSRLNHQTLRVPQIAYFGRGGSGRAAELPGPVHIPSASHPYLVEMRNAPDRPVEEQRFRQLIQSETAVPLFSAGKVIGTITAISFKPFTHRMRRDGRSWVSEQQGIHPLHTSLLEFHARWLGPALETIQQIVRRERTLSCLSTTARHVGQLIVRRRPPELRTFVSLVVATHNNGLRFHQAMVAECHNEENGAQRVLLRGKGDFAWGSMSFAEQDHAHAVRASLETDLREVLRRIEARESDCCASIRSNWEAFFRSGLAALPRTPCLVWRRGGSLPVPQVGRVTQCVEATPGDSADRLLDDLCKFFNITLESQAGRDMRVGLVSLASGVDIGRPCSVLLVTNVLFRDPGNSDELAIGVEDILSEWVDALEELANIARLAESAEQGLSVGNGQVRPV